MTAHPATAVEIALVNNMPDAAFAATERQFRGLLEAAGRGRPVHLRLASLPDPGRGGAVRRHLDERYEDLAALERRPPDALVVTGSEPRCRDLREEPTWPDLASLLGWAEEATHSVVLSCLAAHGALLATDGIERRRMDRKLSGVFPQWVDGDHPLTRAVGPLACPHSRLHDVPAGALEAGGYRILVGSDAVGWTVAARDGACLRLLVQGHPEYDATTLLREYRRDVRRFLDGERDDYPELPDGYLGASATARLERFRRRALHRPAGIAEQFPFDACAAGLEASWRVPMVRLLANWIAELRARKAGPARRAG